MCIACLLQNDIRRCEVFEEAARNLKITEPTQVDVRVIVRSMLGSEKRSSISNKHGIKAYDR